MILNKVSKVTLLALMCASIATPAHGWWLSDWLFGTPNAQQEVKTQTAATHLLAIASAAFLLPTCFLGWKWYASNKKNNDLEAKNTKLSSEKDVLSADYATLTAEKKILDENHKKLGILKDKHHYGLLATRESLKALQTEKAIALEKKHWLKRWQHSQQRLKLKKQAQAESDREQEKQRQQRQAFTSVGRVGHSAQPAEETQLMPAAAPIIHAAVTTDPAVVKASQQQQQLHAYQARAAQVAALQSQTQTALYPNGTAAQPSAAVRAQRRPGINNGPVVRKPMDTLSTAELARLVGNV